MQKSGTGSRKRSGTYDEGSIQVLEGLDGLRMRPTMYLSERGDSMAYRAIKEVVDNTLDEYLAGRNKHIELHIDKKRGYYIVADKAEGIPIGIHPKYKKERISTLTLIFTRLHAGGKFNDSAYKSSAGTHGIGASATNAVSESFEVWTHRDGACYYQRFEKGIPKTDVVKKAIPADVSGCLKSKPTRGTVVRVKLDQSIVQGDQETPAGLSVATAQHWLPVLAYLNTGLSVTLSVGTKSKTWINKVGPKLLIDKCLESTGSTPTGRPLIYEDDNITLALQWANYAGDSGFLSYVSCSPTKDHGTHVQGMCEALTKALSKYNPRKVRIVPSDTLLGVVGVLNWRMHGPEFTSQVKDKLASKVTKDVYTKCLPLFEAFFAKSPALAKRIIKMIDANHRAKQQQKQMIESVAEAHTKTKGMLLPGILLTAPDCAPEKRELFIVEGDSAAGCHSGDTEVLLADGNKKTFYQLVEDFKNGVDNYGIAFNLTKKRFTKFKLYHPRITKYVTEMCEIVFDNGVVWRGTPDHPWLLTNGKYKRADELGPDDVIQEVPNPSDVLGLLDSEP